MRIGDSTSAIQAARQTASTPSEMSAERQVAVLKKALDSQQDAAERLLRMLEPKGQVIDIRA